MIRHVIVCIILAVMLTGGAVAEPQEESTRRLAQQGDANAQAMLGLMYAAGSSVPQDDAEAVKWYRRAAEQGHAGGQTMLGMSYAEGSGLPQDYAEAVKWLSLAAEQGAPMAQYSLGLLHAKGRGVPRDTVRAHMYFNLAAAKGFREAEKARDIAASIMTPEQLDEAQKLVQEWKSK